MLPAAAERIRSNRQPGFCRAFFHNRHRRFGRQAHQFRCAVFLDQFVGRTFADLGHQLCGSAGTFSRLQFTPDLLPTDVVGLTVWNRNDSEFEFRPGPVFGNIVLAVTTLGFSALG